MFASVPQSRSPRMSAGQRARPIVSSNCHSPGALYKDVQDGTDGAGLALQVPAQALRHRDDPLAHGQRRDDMIDQMRGGLAP